MTEEAALKGCLKSLQNVSKYCLPYFSGGSEEWDPEKEILPDQEEQSDAAAAMLLEGH